MNIKGLIVDFDGTIITQHINFERIFQKIQALLTLYGLKQPKKNLPVLEYLNEVKRLNRQKSKMFLRQAHNILIKEEKQSSKKSKPIKGVPEFLEKLVRAGFAVGIVTRNSRMIVEEILKKRKIPYHILLAREDVKKPKPHPSHIDIMRKKLHLKRSETIVAGDHPFDVIAAKKLGIIACGVLSGGKKPEDFIREGADFVYKDITWLEYLLGLKALPQGKIDHQLLRYLIKKYCVLDKSVLQGPGIGIDAAVVKTSSSFLTLKIDPVTFVSKNIGEYAVNISANDVVCMAANPRWLFVSAVFPSPIQFPEIEKIFNDISMICKKLKIAYVGGHTEISSSVSKPVVTSAMVGEKLQGIKQTKKIKENDALMLVKEIGIEGASILARENIVLERKFPAYTKQALEAIKKPGISIVNEAITAWKSVPIIKMHDPTEGGLFCGIAELAESLGCGFVIEEEKINIYKPARVFSDYLGIDIYGLISSGCLLVVVPKNFANRLVSIYKKKKIPSAIIGVATKEKKLLLKMKNGKIKKIPFSVHDQIIHKLRIEAS